MKPDPAVSCQVIHDQPFGPESVAMARDLPPWWSVARARAPGFYDPVHDAWFVTRYAEPLEVLGQPMVLSNAGANRFKPLTPALREGYPDGQPGRHSIHKMDVPEHTRVPKLAQQAFTPKIVSLLEPKVRGRCEDLVGAFLDDGRCDYAIQVARILPVQVVADITGAPLDLAVISPRGDSMTSRWSKARRRHTGARARDRRTWPQGCGMDERVHRPTPGSAHATILRRR